MGPAAALGIGLWSEAASYPLQDMKNEQARRHYGKSLGISNKYAMEMWNKTGPGPTKDAIERAGLNPGLMYGMSGAGGGTATATGGNAQNTASKGMDIAGAAQLALLRAQTENIEADTAQKQAVTTKTAGVDTAKAKTEIESLTAGIELTKQTVNNKEAEERLTRIQTSLVEFEAMYQENTLDARIKATELQTGKMENELGILMNQKDISDKTKQTIVAQVQLDYLTNLLNNEATKQGISESKSRQALMSEQGKGILANIQQGYMQLDLGNRNARNQELGTELNRQMLDLNKLTGIPVEVLKSVIGAGILKNVFSPQGRTVIEGFKPKY